jgi:hypothetical protein
MSRKMKNIAAVLLIICVMVTLTACGTQTATQTPASKYPEKPITNLIGFNPGGGSDQLAQLTNPFLAKYLNTSMTNVYKPARPVPLPGRNWRNKPKMMDIPSALPRLPCS